MSVFRSYFDCFLPELRNFNYLLWAKVIVIYKLVLPIMFLIMYILYREQYSERDNLIIISNIILFIIGLENGIGVFSWMVSEKFSIYTVIFLILQLNIKFKSGFIYNVDQDKTDEFKLYILFRHFNELMCKSLSWLNFATMVPAIFMLLLITACTCQIKLFQQLIKRNLPDLQQEVFYEYNGDEEIECSICMEEFKQKEKYVELPCKHIFHYKCFGKWRSYKQFCPVCRRTIEKKQIIKINQEFQQSNIELAEI